MNKLVVLLSQLVEHYNMKSDPIHIYFLERIKNYLSKTHSLKLYFKPDAKLSCSSFVQQQQHTPSKVAQNSFIINSPIFSDEEATPPNRYLVEDSVAAASLNKTYSPDHTIESNRQRVKKSMNFQNYKQARMSLLQVFIFSLFQLSIPPLLFLQKNNSSLNIK